MTRIARQVARRDKNEPLIVEALRKAGCTVYLLDAPVDLLVASPRTKQWHLLEVKTTHGRISKGQSAFMRIHEGGAPCAIVRSVEEALEAVGLV